jgi:branched-subunit amino acid transport protein
VSTWSALAIVLMVGAMTYAMRASVIVALAGRSIPVPVARALRQVGPAVLSALAINLAAGGEAGTISLGVPEAAALVVAGVVAWWRRHLMISLLAGMSTLWILSALG